ncbi:DUF637 domain-containing protein [Cupriavidus sp. CV2]|nr:DUF637 domain-containing protein [Cupriavidus sp. CV2]
MFSSDKRHDVWACGSPDQCAALYGSAYTATGGVIDPPTPVGNIAGTIQAPNLTISSGGQIQNVGNVIGTEVSLTGVRLINGITTANTYTPRVNAPSQVISLSPVTMPGLNLGLPRSVGSGSLPTPVPGKASYVDGQLNPALSAGFGPQTLIDNLPATLQPGSTLFYYNPEEENLLLQQASLKETGKASFIDGLAYDSKQNLSPTQIEKAILYQNALEYAKTNGLQLGAALTQAQVGALDKPMLWYVEQTVPDPRCTATGVGVCPTITALMPQVYLPSNTSAMSAGGNISGQNVTLNFNQDGNGSILNTGSISASGTLSVDTNTLTNQANVVDVGEIWDKVSGGYTKVTGTQVQPGGFMSAADMDLNVQTLSGIGGMLQKLNGDGTIDQAGTQQLLADLQQRLGGNFTQVEVKDNLHTDFVKEGGSFGVIQLVAIVAAVAMSFVLGPEMLAAFDALIDPIALAAMSPGLMEFASVASYALAAGSTAFVANGASQLISTGSFDLGAGLKGAAVSALTAGLTQGLVGNSGINTVGVVTEADPATTLANLGNTAVKIGERGLIGAGVNAAINGGSFGQAWLNSVGNDFAAVGANGIGSSELFGSGPLNVLAHAALGCAAQSLLGGDCAGGAIGGATSALVANQIAGLVTDGHGHPSPAQLATITALSMLAGGGIAAALGQDPLAVANAAQNETLNNTCAGNHLCSKAVDQPLQEAGASGGGQIRFGSAAGAEGDIASGVTDAQRAGSNSQSLGGNVRLYPDGSLRTPDGKFASVSGSPPPRNAASQFAEYLSSNGVNVVGKEVVVNGPLGARRFDIVTQDANGILHGIEIKSGGASPTLYQQFTDQFVNMFGVSGTGRFVGKTIGTATTVYVP